MQLKVRFKIERSTKRTYRYTEVDSGGVPVVWGTHKIGALYVRKEVFDLVGNPPEFLEATFVESNADDN